MSISLTDEVPINLTFIFSDYLSIFNIIRGFGQSVLVTTVIKTQSRCHF